MMMMMGESRRESHAPPWVDPQQQTTSPPLSPSLITGYLEPDPNDLFEYINYFPCGDNYYQDDEFFMYEFKIRKCTRVRAHDWTECPFAHPGEKARRRDPRKYHYSGTACSDFRKGGCKKGDSCEFSHGVFECWLHPTRFRTQPCKDGSGCTRRVCFFAHNPDQLRVGSGVVTSPRGTGSSHNSDDGALSVGSGSGLGSVGELVASLRNLQLNKVKSMPSSWAGGGVGNIQVGSPVFGSPRGGGCGSGSPALMNRAGFFSLPTTPTRPGIGYLDMWDANNNSNKDVCEEEPVMERVESGRALRARMFEKLSKENPLNGPGSDPIETSGSDFDVGWVSDLVK